MSTEASPISFFLLRGLAREVRHWGEFHRRLETAQSNFTVIPLEIPGTGKLRAERSPTSMRKYVEKLRSQYLQHSRKGRINILLGLSFGDMITARWINDFPSDFHGAILINTSGRPSPFHKRLRVSAAATLLAAGLKRSTYLREKKIAGLICNLADTNDLARSWQVIADSAPVSVPNLLRQLYTAATFTLPGEITLPTLLLGSRKDRMADPACMRYIADIWNVKMITHPQAGHDLTTDDPDWCISSIQGWLPQMHP